jgi:hypothetical protein
MKLLGIPEETYEINLKGTHENYRNIMKNNWQNVGIISISMCAY